MSNKESAGKQPPEEKTRRQVSDIRRISKVMFGRKIVIIGTVIILILILTALLAPLIAPYDPNQQNLRMTLQQPSQSYLLGTDEQGRDVLSRMIYGAQISIVVGVVTVTIAGVVGMGLGLIAGYFKGWVNIIIMRVVDAVLAIPPLVLMLAIASVLGGGLINILIAIGIGMTPTYCRLMCGQVLSIKESDYIVAANIIGQSDFKIILSHVLPNAFPPLLVLITMNLGTAILMEATLSFLGIGVNPPTATWGAMVSGGYRYLITNPALSLAPGIVILIIVLAFNMVGDGLRDALDPRLRGRI